MAAQLQNIFNFSKNSEYIIVDLETKKGCKIKVAGTVDKPYFCGKDVCEILEYSDIKQALRNHVDQCDKKTLNEVCIENNEFNNIRIGKIYENLSYNDGKAIYISEAGLYSLIFQSKAKFAKDFRNIVFREILPSIRKYGEYIRDKHYEKELKLKTQPDQQIIEEKRIIEDKKELEKELELSKRIVLRLKNKLIESKKLTETQIADISTSESYASQNSFLERQIVEVYDISGGKVTHKTLEERFRCEYTFIKGQNKGKKCGKMTKSFDAQNVSKCYKHM